MQLTNKQINIEKVISHIKKNSGCSTSDIAIALRKSNRTINNYIKDIQNGYVKDVKIIVENRKYSIIDNREPINFNIANEERKVYLKLALDSVEKLDNLSMHHAEIEKQMGLDKLNNPYYIKSETYENIDIKDYDTELLSNAIKEDKLVVFIYENKYYYVEPYRLVNFDGLWYLYGKDTQEKVSNPYKTWLLSKIEKVEKEHRQKHNMPDEKIDEILEDAQSPYFIQDKKIKVVLEISNEIKDIITAKEHFLNQKVISESSRYFVLEAEATTYKDIDQEIKAWIPYIKIKEPIEYKEKLRKEINDYLANIDTFDQK
jgi:predicted DNA-binding transcriptional regulator YafY